jgi:hypothetical protein
VLLAVDGGEQRGVSADQRGAQVREQRAVGQKDYLTYRRGLSGKGATLADGKKITVDGHSATLMTVIAEHDLDGSIGCP